MTDGQRDLIRYRLERALETLQEARSALEVDMGKFYSRVFDHRLESDYGEVVELDKDDIKADLDKAEKFIAHIRSLVGSTGDGSL